MAIERLEQMMRLVMQCKPFAGQHIVELQINNGGDHNVYIHWDVGSENSRVMYYECQDEWWVEHGDNTHILDQNFEKAEAAIRALLEVYG